jgi:IS5 family transposase
LVQTKDFGLVLCYPFRVLKCEFGYRKTRYRGLAKNEAQLFTLFGLGTFSW